MIRLSELADALPGSRLEGDDTEIEDVTEPGHGDECTAEIWMEGNPETGVPLIVDANVTPVNSESTLIVENLSEKLAQLLEKFTGPTNEWGIHERASLHESVQVDEPVHIGPYTHIGEDVRIGSEVIIESGVTISGDFEVGDGSHIHPGVKIVASGHIGQSTIIHANTVIGSDGFGYDQNNGKHSKVPQIGSVEIGSNVEIGANCAIDRGTYGPTEIGSGTKLDNQVHVAHNTKIGEDCLLVAKSGTAGSAELSDRVWIGGQSAVREHVMLEEDVKVAARSGVTKDVDQKGKIVSGFPARNHREVLKQKAVVSKLPALRQRIRKLENRLNEEQNNQN